MTQAELLKQAFLLIVKSKVCVDTPIRDWVKILLFAHKKGYLYAHSDNDKIDMIACMYRMPKVTKKTADVFPEKEKGNILYVSFFVSRAKDDKLTNRLFKSYLDRHPKIKEVAFYERGNESKLRKFKRATKEKKNV